MRDEHLRLGALDCDIVNEARVLDFDIVIGPLGEQFGSIFEGDLSLFFLKLDLRSVLRHVVVNIKIFYI